MDLNMFDNMMDMAEMMKHHNNKPNSGNSSPGSMNKSAFPAETPIAMAYVPFQQWEEPYKDAEGFDNGTIFPSLNQPFLAWMEDYNG